MRAVRLRASEISDVQLSCYLLRLFCSGRLRWATPTIVLRARMFGNCFPTVGECLERKYNARITAAAPAPPSLQVFDGLRGVAGRSGSRRTNDRRGRRISPLAKSL